MVSLIDLLSNTYAPVQMIILPYLDVADVIALTLTCKGFDQLQPTLKVTSYDINRFLKRFFDDPLEFRSVQAECGAIVAGKAIHAWFDRSNKVPKELLIYVPEKQREPMNNYIQNEYETTMGSETACGSTGPIAQLFEDCFFTADLCFITWDKAYALFPYTTFIRKEGYLLEDIDAFDVDPREGPGADLKLKSVSWARGCSHVDLDVSGLQDLVSLGQEVEEIRELARRRRIGDKHTRSIELDTSEVRASTVPNAVLESSTFQLRDQSSHLSLGDVSHYVLEYDSSLLCHPVLKYTYLLLDVDEKHCYYTTRCEALAHRLDEMTRIELSKMSPDIRPREYSAICDDVTKAKFLRGNFAPPNTWTYYDDDVIAFLDKAWKVQQSIDKKGEAARKAKFESLTS